MRKLLNKVLVCTLAVTLWAINPIAEWSKPFPAQHLVTKLSPSQPSHSSLETKFETTAPQKPDYEMVVVFSLQATIAAFHFDPKTFTEDQARLKKYFDDNALNQISQILLPGSGRGFLDQCFLKQEPCDAITHHPVIIEKKTPHYFQVRLPMIMSTEEKVDVILSLSYNYPNPMRVTNFAIEKQK